MQVNRRFTHKLFGSLAALALLELGATAARAQYRELEVWPSAEPDIVSAMLWRTGVTVRSIDESLKLYRDILGMTPVYAPATQSDPRLEAFSGLKPGQKLRLLVLRTETAGDAALNVGYLGLAEVLEADGSRAQLKAPARDASARYGQIGILFMVEDIMTIARKVEEGGYTILSKPTKRADGSNTQLLMLGPDGERLWITERRRIPTYLKKPEQLPQMPPSAAVDTRTP